MNHLTIYFFSYSTFKKIYVLFRFISLMPARLYALLQKKKTRSHNNNVRKRSNKHQLFCFTCILEIFLEAGFKKASRVLNRFLLYVKLCKNSRWFVGNNDDEQISAIICHCLIFQEWRIGTPDENAYTNPPFFDQVYSTHLSLIITNTRLIGKLDWITFLSGGEGERDE